MPVYNAAQYIESSVKSVLRQTIQNIEIIIVNDGSTDATGPLLHLLARKDARITLIERGNQGIVSALNAGIEQARARYIARMDADDICQESRLARQLDWLQANDADICGSWVQQFGTIEKRVRYPISHAACETRLFFWPPFAHPAVMMRKIVVERFPYDAHYQNAEDYDLWHRAAVAGYRFSNVPEFLLRYRVHSHQVTQRSRVEMQKKAIAIRKRHWSVKFPELSKVGLAAVSNLAEAFNTDPLIAAPALQKAAYLVDSDECRRVIKQGILEAIEQATPNGYLFGDFWREIFQESANTARSRAALELECRALNKLAHLRHLGSHKRFGALFNLTKLLLNRPQESQ